MSWKRTVKLQVFPAWKEITQKSIKHINSCLLNRNPRKKVNPAKPFNKRENLYISKIMEANVFSPIEPFPTHNYWITLNNQNWMELLKFKRLVSNLKLVTCRRHLIVIFVTATLAFIRKTFILGCTMEYRGCDEVSNEHVIRCTYMINTHCPWNIRWN